MKKTITASALILLGLMGARAAQADGVPAGLDFDKADLASFEMVMISDGKEVGSMQHGWRRAGDKFMIDDRTTMNPDILETATAVIDAESLRPLSVQVNFTQGENYLKVDLAWHEGRRSGHLAMRQSPNSLREKDVDEEDAAPAPLRMAVFGMIAALPLEDGYESRFDWFNSLANKTETVTLAVVGHEKVESPAGSADCVVVAVSGTETENRVYLSETLPRRIMRIDVVGQPMYFLRQP